MKLHIITIDKNKNIVFFPNNLNYFTADNATTELVKEIAEGTYYTELEKKYSGLSYDSYLDIKNKININNCHRVNSILDSQLDRLIINISNDCNMRCVYCYANHGTYGGAINYISLELLEKTLNTFYDVFDEIGMLQLFGGEPTMNMDAIEFVGKYIKDKGYSTQIGLVTNATLINKRFIELINTYNIYVTVSVDIQMLHDKLRPLPNGVNSWSIINKNIHLLKKETAQPTQIELTYTNVHDETDIALFDILSEIDAEYGDIPVHIAPVCSDDERYHLKSRNRFISAVHEIYTKRNPDKDITFSSLKSYELSLKHRNAFDYFCGAGISTLAVSTVGDIYPCFYFIDNKEFYITNVKENHDFIKNEILKVRKDFYKNTKSSNEKCKRCFARPVCNGCLGANLSETGNPYEASEDHCIMTKGIIEEILKENFLSKTEIG